MYEMDNINKLDSIKCSLKFRIIGGINKSKGKIKRLLILLPDGKQ